MADVDDQWHKTVDGKKVRTAKYGTGKRWRARWRDETGRQRQQAFERKLDADRHVATVEADMLRKTYIDPRASRTTFKAYAEKWRAAQIHEDSTETQVEANLRRHVYPIFGDRELGSIRKSEAQAWVRGMERGREGQNPLWPATVQVVVRYVVAIGHAAVADKLLTENPFIKLKLTKPVKKRLVVATGEQIATMYGMLPPRLRALIALGSSTGVRQGEAFGMEVDCVDFLRRKVEIRQQLVLPVGGPAYLRLPKGRKTRTVPLADTPALILAEHIRQFSPVTVTIEDRTNPASPVWREARLLFTMFGKPVRRSWFSEMWCKARRLSGLPTWLTFHDNRHYYASALIRHNESVTTVQSRLGHATAMETLNTYSHLWPDSEERTRAAIEDTFTHDVGAMWAESTEDATDQELSG